MLKGIRIWIYITLAIGISTVWIYTRGPKPNIGEILLVAAMSIMWVILAQAIYLWLKNRNSK